MSGPLYPCPPCMQKAAAHGPWPQPGCSFSQSPRSRLRQPSPHRSGQATVVNQTPEPPKRILSLAGTKRVFNFTLKTSCSQALAWVRTTLPPACAINLNKPLQDKVPQLLLGHQAPFRCGGGEGAQAAPKLRAREGSGSVAGLLLQPHKHKHSQNYTPTHT